MSLKMNSSQKKYDGFTLIELMVAVSIMTVAVLGVGSAIFTTIKLNDQTHQVALATFAASEKMDEILISRDILAFKGQYFPISELAIRRRDSEPPEIQPGFVAIDDTTNPGTYHIKIIVQWNVRGTPRRREVFLETVVLAPANPF